jgi:hypothetical protein
MPETLFVFDNLDESCGGEGGSLKIVVSNCSRMNLDVYLEAYPSNYLSRWWAMAAFGSPL